MEIATPANHPVMEALATSEHSYAYDVPVGLIRNSPTNRRTVWGDLVALSEDIKLRGIQQPLIGRPMETEVGNWIELVAGERRLRAAKLATLDFVPMIVKEMTDREALEVQYVENFDRQDPHPLDEALWAEEFVKASSVEEAAARMGKDASYVRRRLRLLKLCEPVRLAFYEGKLSLGRAEVIAAVDDHKIQEKVLGEACDTEYSTVSVSKVRGLVERHILSLAAAPFDRKSVDLVPEAGACTTCTHNTDTTTDLFEDLDSKKATCTKPSCFRAKEKAFVQLQISKAQEKGREVLTASQAKKVLQKPDRWESKKGYAVKPDAEFVDLKAPVDGDPKGRTLAQLVGEKAKDAAKVAVDGAGKVHELVPRDEAKKLLDEAGVKLKAPPKKAASSGRDDYAEQQAKDAIRTAVVKEAKGLLREAIRSKKPESLRSLVELFLYEDGALREPELIKAYELKGNNMLTAFGKLGDETFRTLLTEVLAVPSYVQTWNGYPDDFLQTCSSYGIDVKAIEKRLSGGSEKKQIEKKPDDSKPAKKKAGKK